jgi:5'-deoxynucleotidase YfbR-like HD superfamily hydrolase
MFVTNSGHIIEDPSLITKDDIKIEDIAFALSRIPRFGGHSAAFYSVALHSMNCEFVAMKEGMSKRERLMVLLHDAAEAYIGDVISPVKRLLPKFQDIEHDYMYVIRRKFNAAPFTAEMKVIDRRMTATEAFVIGTNKYLQNGQHWSTTISQVYHNYMFDFDDSYGEHEDHFMDRFIHLSTDRKKWI